MDNEFNVRGMQEARQVRVVQRCIDGWRVALGKIMDHRDRLAAAVNLWLKACLWAAVHGWKQAVATVKHQREIVGNVLRRMMQRTLAGTYKRWSSWVMWRRTCVSVELWGEAFLAKAAMTRCFERWGVIAVCLRKGRRVRLRQVMVSPPQPQRRACFRTHAGERADGQCAMQVAWHEDMRAVRLWRHFIGWQAHVATRQRKRAKLRMVVKRWQNRTLIGFFQRWQDAAGRTKLLLEPLVCL